MEQVGVVPRTVRVVPRTVRVVPRTVRVVPSMVGVVPSMRTEAGLRAGRGECTRPQTPFPPYTAAAPTYASLPPATGGPPVQMSYTRPLRPLGALVSPRNHPWYPGDHHQGARGRSTGSSRSGGCVQTNAPFGSESSSVTHMGEQRTHDSGLSACECSPRGSIRTARARRPARRPVVGCICLRVLLTAGATVRIVHWDTACAPLDLTGQLRPGPGG